MNKDINRIVELEIDLDDMQLEEMGVDVVSFVNEPAIEVDFLAFNKEIDTYVEEFVYPRAGEDKDEFISRCIPVVIDEGYEEDRAAAICYSYYEGQEFNEDLSIFGYVPNHFDICPAATNLFEHLVMMQPDEETIGMIRSAALQADKIFEIEKRVLQLQEATERDVRQASLLANDFVDLMREIDEELEMSHNISWMMGHIETIASYYKGSEEFLPENPCQDGWVAYGMKTKNGRQVPNCIPVENEMEFQSYNDYPESAKNAAKRALEWRDSHPDQGCGTRVGWARANQLAKGENISEETIARMASFARHLQYKDVPYSEGCGGLMVDAWGGQAGIEWAQNKLETIREESSYDPSSLSPYVDYGDDLRRKEFADECDECRVMTTEEEEIILKWAEEHGEVVTEEYTCINLEEEFSTVGDIATAIQGLDILGKLGIRKDEPAEIKYKYSGPSAERNFCKAMMRLNKLYDDGDMISLKSRLSTINPGMGPEGDDTYDVFKYKGSVNCRHFWSKMALFKPEGSRRVLMVDQGPAEGDAGKSNNSNRPSPSGSVRNNASLRRRNFSFSTDDDKRIVAGPLMIPNQFIMRRDENNEPYYVYFSRNTIKRIQERFNAQKRHNITDLDHDGEIIEDNILLEQWIVESKQYDKARFYGFDNLPLGTWFGVYKVNNDKTWKRIKNGKLKGFSIAGDFINKAKPIIDSEEDKLSKIINILKKIDE